MSTRVHYIVTRWRHGWSVNVNADRLSEHEDLQLARDQAAMLTRTTCAEGGAATMIDLSEELAEPASDRN